MPAVLESNNLFPEATKMSLIECREDVDMFGDDADYCECAKKVTIQTNNPTPLQQDLSDEFINQFEKSIFSIINDMNYLQYKVENYIENNPKYNNLSLEESLALPEFNPGPEGVFTTQQSCNIEESLVKAIESCDYANLDSKSGKKYIDIIKGFKERIRTDLITGGNPYQNVSPYNQKKCSKNSKISILNRCNSSDSTSSCHMSDKEAESLFFEKSKMDLDILTLGLDKSILPVKSSSESIFEYITKK